MSELAFPLLGVALVVLVVLPLCALGVKLLLLVLGRFEIGGGLHGLAPRFLLLTASSGLPIAWFFSAGLHQAESGTSVLACLFQHEAATLCLESGLFALVLAFVVMARSRRLMWETAAPGGVQAQRGALLGRLERVLDAHPSLHPLRHRVDVLDATDFCIGTRGWLRPRVVIGSDFAASLSDEMLAGALGHEAAHVRSLDPLRYLAMEVALAINPFGRRLLEAEVRRWHAARELHCDREAVLQGCPPMALADAILRAARPRSRSAAAPGIVPLGAPDLSVLRLRIRMLLAFSEHPPQRCCSPGLPALPAAALLLLAALLSPHRMGTGALDLLHRGAERAVTYLIRS